MRRQAWPPHAQRFHLLFPFITISFGCPAVIIGCILKLSIQNRFRELKAGAPGYTRLPQAEERRFEGRALPCVEGGARSYATLSWVEARRFSYELLP
jgi:hypothetical protein